MLLLLASLLCPISQGNLDGPPDWPDNMPLHGTIYKGDLYGFFATKNSEGLSIFTITISDPNRYPVRRILPDSFFDVGLYLHHRLSHGALWHATGKSTINRMPLDEMNFFDQANPQRTEQFRKKYPKPGANHIDLLIMALPKLQRKYNDVLYAEQIPPSSPFKRSEGVAGVDIVPIAESTCRCFFFPKSNRSIETWETHHVRDKKGIGWNVHAEEQNLEIFESLFVEPFHAFVRKDDYFFVTESGKLYHAPPPEEGQKKRKMREVWTEPTLPIVAIISDADNDRVWLFVKNKSKGGKADLYLEMRGVARFKEIDPAQLAKVKDAESPRARQLLEYIPLIRPDLAAKKKES